jgi:hypothetical protein
MASLLGLPNELLVQVCGHFWLPAGRGVDRHPLPPVIRLRLTCKRFGFLEGLRYLAYARIGGWDAFVSRTCDGRPEGPAYWLSGGSAYVGYSEYRQSNGQRRCHKKLLPERTGGGSTYHLGGHELPGTLPNGHAFLGLVGRLYADLALPPNVVEFFREGTWGWMGTKLLIAPGFPAAPPAWDSMLAVPLENGMSTF